jgi:hypothetical protein
MRIVTQKVNAAMNVTQMTMVKTWEIFQERDDTIEHLMEVLERQDQLIKIQGRLIEELGDAMNGLCIMLALIVVCAICAKIFAHGTRVRQSRVV